MGEDGHIASIFNSNFFKTKDIIFKYSNPLIKYERLSLSLNLLLNSEHKILLTSGNTKYSLIKNLHLNTNSTIKNFVDNSNYIKWFHYEMLFLIHH